MAYSHRSLTGTPLTVTQRPNWNTFLGSVNVSLTESVKNVLFEVMYFRKAPKSIIAEKILLRTFY